ncbi:MAG: ribonuclease Z [Candidatus Woesearchaeota archaeon]
MKVTFLGTSCMMPTKERNTSAVFISHKNEGILIDCGEGTQRQLMLAGIRPTKITKILLTHWHGDHSLGLPGLVQTMAAMSYPGILEIYGPKGTVKRFNSIENSFYFDLRLKVKVREVEGGVFFESKDIRLEAAEMQHPVPCNAYAVIEADRRKINLNVTKKLGIPEGVLLGELQEGKTIQWKGRKVTPEEATIVVRGKKVAFITDTIVTKKCEEIAADADLLICEAVYASNLAEQAKKYGHMTALESAQLAARANVKKLVLTHFSARYKDTAELELDARTAFDNVIAAKDFMEIIV